MVLKTHGGTPLMAMSSLKCGTREQTLKAIKSATPFLLLCFLLITLSVGYCAEAETQIPSSASEEAVRLARRILEVMSREIKGAVLITAASGPEAEPPTQGIAKRADFVGLDSSNLQNWRNGQQQYSDQIYFVAPVTNSGRQELCILGYWIKDVEGDTGAPVTIGGVPTNSKEDALCRCYCTDGWGTSSDVWNTFNFADPGLTTFSTSWGKMAAGVRCLDIQYYDYLYLGGTGPALKEFNSWDSLPSTIGGTTSTPDDDNKLPVAIRITIVVGDEQDLVEPVKLSTIVYLENAERR